MPVTLQVVLRGLLSYGTLLVLARAMGKQQVGQLSFFDYITGITVGSIAAGLTVEVQTSAWPFWVGLIIWTALTILVQYISLSSRSVATFLTGEPVLVMSEGRILEQNMKRNRYTYEELFMQLRQRDIFDLNRVAFAILENTGELSIQLKSDAPEKSWRSTSKTPLSPSVLLVHEGEVMQRNLDSTGLDSDWLQQAIRHKGIHSVSEVTVAVMDAQGSLYVDKYDDSHPEHASGEEG